MNRLDFFKRFCVLCGLGFLFKHKPIGVKQPRLHENLSLGYRQVTDPITGEHRYVLDSVSVIDKEQTLVPEFIIKELDRLENTPGPFERGMYNKQ